MPTSRGRRFRSRSSRATKARARHTADPDRRALAQLPLLQATDAAEARGDAGEALCLIGEDFERRGDEHFWRPERVRRLEQLFCLEPMLPRWATSRWVLAQAAQWLDPRMRGRHLRAIEVAVETRGGEETLSGVDAVDAQVKVMDHDWVYRQVFLYELGALQSFLDRGAAPDLLAGADRIRDWAASPMGAYRLVGESPASLTWVDLASGSEVASLNIGSASWLAQGECAIGRLVPIEGGAMFETAPLFVPDDVAQQVAADPVGWIAAVADGCRRDAPAEQCIRTSGCHDFGMLSDVPSSLRYAVALSTAEQTADKRVRLETELGTHEVALIRAALDDRLSSVELPIDPWPSVAATLVEPRVIRGLADLLGAGDAPQLLRLAGLLPCPAADVCRDLARSLAAAA